MDKVLEHDPPSDGPLLDGDKTTTNGGSGDFGLVDGDYGRSEANGHASDDATDDEHATVLRKLIGSMRKEDELRQKDTYDGSTLEDGADYPNKTCEDDRELATDAISEVGDGESADERTSGHGGDDSTLGI